MGERGEKRPRSKLFGELIRHYRRVNTGLSITELAKKIHVNHSHLSRIEVGQRYPDPDVAIDLGDALRVPPPKQAEFLLRAQYPDEVVDTVLAEYRKAVATEIYEGVEVKIVPVPKPIKSLL
jgi:ribosome-binding protein aMBF1 (putative translation factor)